MSSLLSFSSSGSKNIAIVTFVATIISLLLLYGFGLRKGLDFNGGVVVEFYVTDDSTFANPSKSNIAEFRSLLDRNLNNNFSLQILNNNQWGVSVATDVIKTDSQIEDISLKLKQIFNQSVKIVKAEYIGPQVTKILYKQAITGLFLSLLAILVYVTIRFNFIFGLVGLLCLLHDITISLAFLSVTKIEFSLIIVAALLTIIGYSINNTIVIYDRIRNLTKSKDTGGGNIISHAVRQVLKRTIITSALTIFSLCGLVFFSDVSIKNFAVTVICGIVAGGYSSSLLAPALLVIYRAPLCFIDHDSKYATVKSSSHYTS